MKLNQPPALLILFALLFATSASSQTTTSNSKDSIRIVKNFWGTKYFQGDKQLKLAAVSETLKSNTEAYTQFKKGKSNYVLAQILGFIGGAVVGWELGKSISGKEGGVNGPVVGIGAGVIVSSIIFGVSGEKKMKKGIRIYNAALY